MLFLIFSPLDIIQSSVLGSLITLFFGFWALLSVNQRNERIAQYDKLFANFNQIHERSVHSVIRDWCYKNCPYTKPLSSHTIDNRSLCGRLDLINYAYAIDLAKWGERYRSVM